VTFITSLNEENQCANLRSLFMDVLLLLSLFISLFSTRCVRYQSSRYCHDVRLNRPSVRLGRTCIV